MLTTKVRVQSRGDGIIQIDNCTVVQSYSSILVAVQQKDIQEVANFTICRPNYRIYLSSGPRKPLALFLLMRRKTRVSKEDTVYSVFRHGNCVYRNGFHVNFRLSMEQRACLLGRITPRCINMSQLERINHSQQNLGLKAYSDQFMHTQIFISMFTIPYNLTSFDTVKESCF